MSLVSQQPEHIVRDVQDFVVEPPLASSHARASDTAMRQLVAEQLLAAMSGPDGAEQEWARKIFSSQGFLDETINKLRIADAAGERAAAARTLGIAGSHLATAHLVAGLFDNEPEVSQAAAEALARIDDPAVAIGALNLPRSFAGDQATMDRLTAEVVSNPGTEREQRNSATKGSEETAQADASFDKHSSPGDPAAKSEDFSDVPSDLVANLESSLPEKRIQALDKLAWSGASAAFKLIARSFADTCPDVRKAAAHALYELKPGDAAESFRRAIEEEIPDQSRNIGAALHASGLAQRAIDDLAGNSRASAYNALCLLFVMAKTGEVQPLVEAIEQHRSVEVRCAAVRLLTLNGQAELAAEAAKRRLNVRA